MTEDYYYMIVDIIIYVSYIYKISQTNNSEKMLEKKRNNTHKKNIKNLCGLILVYIYG